MDRRLLVAAPSAPIVYEVTGRLARPGTQIKIAQRAGPALVWIAEGRFDVVLVAPQLDDRSGLTIVQAAAAANAASVALLWDHGWPPPSASMLEEATDSVHLPAEWWRLDLAVRLASENRPLVHRPPETDKPVSGLQSVSSLVACCPAMKSAMEQASTAAKSRASVLITGAQGTGRTTIAHAIPTAAHQAKERLTHVPIADLPEELVDDLIAGRLAPAHDHEGPALPTCWNAETLILDDVQSLSRTRQAQLLAALEQRQTLPRLIATASDDLEDRVADGRFLKPLATRLDQARITLPTLADRSSHDLISLATHFLNRRDPSRSLAPDLLQWVASRSWPGNLVELDQFIARLATDNNAPSLRLCHLPGSQRESSGTVLLAESDYERPWAEVADLASERIESAYFRQLMPLCNGRVDRCAQRSGMSRRSVGEKLSRHGIDKADYRPTRPRGGS